MTADLGDWFTDLDAEYADSDFGPGGPDDAGDVFEEAAADGYSTGFEAKPLADALSRWKDFGSAVLQAVTDGHAAGCVARLLAVRVVVGEPGAVPGF